MPANSARDGAKNSHRLVGVVRGAKKLNCRRSGRGCGALLLEALATKYRPALSRLKGNGGFLAASRTIGAGLYFGVVAGRSRAHVGSPFCLAGFAPLRLVLELFIVKEKLLSGSEDEIPAAVDTLQNLVLEFHGDVLPSVRESQAEEEGIATFRDERTESPRRLLQFQRLGATPGFGPPCWQHGYCI